MIFWLYLIDVLACLKQILDVINGVAFVGLILLIVFLLWAAHEGEEGILGRGKKYLKKYIACFALSLFVYMGIPSQKTMYLMVSSKVVHDVVTHDKLSGLTEKSLKLLEKKLDEMVGEKK